VSEKIEKFIWTFGLVLVLVGIGIIVCLSVLEYRQGMSKWDELEKRTAETARKLEETKKQMQQVCRDTVKLCEQVTHKPCGSCE
jgi:hypothetical protein